jgi:hypothetical protein
VQLDKLPSTTTNSEIQVSGTLTSASAFIEEVIVRVNGVVAGTAVFSRDGGRFEAGAALAPGSNVIEVEAIDGTGAHGYDTGYTHRVSAFVPPAITIATPAQGTFFQCNNITVTGTYDPGSSQLGSITIPHPDPLSNMMCAVTIIDDSNFSADCGVIFNGGTYNINATLETTESVQATVSRGIIVGDCF